MVCNIANIGSLHFCSLSIDLHRNTQMPQILATYFFFFFIFKNMNCLLWTVKVCVAVPKCLKVEWKIKIISKVSENKNMSDRYTKISEAIVESSFAVKLRIYWSSFASLLIFACNTIRIKSIALILRWQWWQRKKTNAQEKRKEPEQARER